MKKLFTAITLLFATVFSIMSQNFTYQGINYTVINAAQKLCMTQAGTEGSTEQMFYPTVYRPANKVEGELVIPEEALFAGVPYKVVAIGIGSFAENDITSLVLPKTVTEIGAGAFSCCRELLEVTLPENLALIHNSAFLSCYKLQQISLPNSVKELGRFAFYDCWDLKTVKLSNSLKELKHAVFYRCGKLSEIEIPESVTKLGDGDGGFGDCFRECTSLKVIKLPSKLTYIGWNVFMDCKSLESIYIPDSVTLMMYSAFRNCASLKSVHLSKSITSIYNMTFEGCESLEYIEIPYSIKSIGMTAFARCSKLTKAILPASLTFIDQQAFSQCSALSEVECYAVKPPETASAVFESVFLSYATLHVPQGTKSSYEKASTWGNFGEIIADLPIYSGKNEFFNEGNYQYKIIDADLKTVSVAGFNTTKGEQTGDLFIPSSVTYSNKTYKVISVDDFAFYGSKMRSVEVSGSIETLGNWAFANCAGLLVARLSDSVTELGSGVFSGCSSLEKVYLSDNVNSIGNAAFSNCVSLHSFGIPAGVLAIPASMLEGCSSLKEILIPNNVTYIGENAFQGCSSLNNIDLGVNVYYISDYAFADCPNISEIHSMALNPPYAEAYTFPAESYENATVTVREQSLMTYTRENPWYRFQNYLTVPGAISLSHYQVDMAGNEVFQLGVYGSDSEIVWSSSNPAVAYVNDCGLIVAMGVTGATVITATVEGEKVNCNVTVSSPYRDPQSVRRTRAGEEEDIQPVDIIMENVSGNPPVVNIRLVPVGSKTIIDWTSSNPSMASVENGIVTVHSEGDVVFGVESENGIEESMAVNTLSFDPDGIDEIFQSADPIMPVNVYDFTGRVILFNATVEQIKNLSPGIYVVGNKVVLVK